ncbi:hypothetical protein V5799_008247 [Amblyomma americanum]|uniref:Uncharacterized protein n=1 Tax=Amblyomma americanum TaxID=6943 RepID=A0AAQ4FEL4_AMBAM
MCAAQASPRLAQRRYGQTTPPKADAVVGLNSQKRKQLSLAYEELTTVPYSLIEKYTADVEVLDLSHNRLAEQGMCSSWYFVINLFCSVPWWLSGYCFRLAAYSTRHCFS